MTVLRYDYITILLYNFFNKFVIHISLVLLGLNQLYVCVCVCMYTHTMHIVLVCQQRKYLEGQHPPIIYTVYYYKTVHILVRGELG